MARTLPTVTIGRELEDGTEQIITVEYEIQEASGDGWNEPHYPACAIVYAPDGLELTPAEEEWAEELAMDQYRAENGPPDYL